jgi:anti-anti-sigma regulatory factor
MTVKITQIKKRRRGDITILQVAGKLYQQDAEILERTFDELKKRDNPRIEIDLSEISFLDDEGAAVLIRLQQSGATLTNLSFFVQKVIEYKE